MYENIGKEDAARSINTHIRPAGHLDGEERAMRQLDSDKQAFVLHPYVERGPDACDQEQILRIPFRLRLAAMVSLSAFLVKHRQLNLTLSVNYLRRTITAARGEASSDTPGWEKKMCDGIDAHANGLLAYPAVPGNNSLCAGVVRPGE